MSQRDEFEHRERRLGGFWAVGEISETLMRRQKGSFGLKGKWRDAILRVCGVGFSTSKVNSEGPGKGALSGEIPFV